MRVTRGSWVALNSGPPVLSLSAATCAIICSALGTMVRSFRTVIGTPKRPTTEWRWITGPRSSSLIQSAAMSEHRQRTKGHSATVTVRSMARLVNRRHLATSLGLDVEHGHARHRRHADALARQAVEAGPELHVEARSQGPAHGLGPGR